MAADGKLASWVCARLRPKVLVATQGKVLEAVADQAGRLVPSVPVISVEPDDPADLWRILAVLCSPVAAAWALERFGGAGLSGQSISFRPPGLTVPTPPELSAGTSRPRLPAASETPQPGRRRRHLRAPRPRSARRTAFPTLTSPGSSDGGTDGCDGRIQKFSASHRNHPEWLSLYGA